MMGSILLLADDGHGAIKEFERALELNPKLPTLRAWYGRALMRMGDGEKAKTVFKSELADNANDFEANLYLGVLLRQDKLFEERLRTCLAQCNCVRAINRLLSSGRRLCCSRVTKRSASAARKRSPGTS
jgi:hypothetical protein